MRDQVSIIALSILDQTEDRSDQDQRTAAVKSIKMFLPGVGSDHAAAGRYPVHANVEGDADDNEEAKEEDLNDETADGDVFAVLESLKCARCHDTATRCLQTETDDIANDEDLCEPFLRDDTVLFAVCEQNDASEFHVYACSE